MGFVADRSLRLFVRPEAVPDLQHIRAGWIRCDAIGNGYSTRVRDASFHLQHEGQAEVARGGPGRQDGGDAAGVNEVREVLHVLRRPGGSVRCY